MKKIIVLLSCFMCFMSFMSVNAENSEYFLLDNSNVRLLGRGEVFYNNQRTFNWPASGFEFEFSGTKAEVYVDKSSFDEEAYEGSYFNLAVYDGDKLIRVERMKLVLGWNTVYEAKANDPAVKKLMLVRSSEPCRGTLTMSKLRCDAQPFATSPRERRIEFIGDSYTAGYGNSAHLSEATYYSAQNTDNWNSYTGMVSRAFGADNTVIAYQGKGVYANRKLEALQNNMSEQFLKSEITIDGNQSSINLSTGKLHNFVGYQPQVVTIWLGTNDEAAGVDITTFKTAYIKLLDNVRAKYPDAVIINMALENSMYLDTIKAISEEKGEENGIYMLVLDEFETTSYDHPDIAEDERIAKQLTDKINSIPGVWDEKSCNQKQEIEFVLKQIGAGFAGVFTLLAM